MFQKAPCDGSRKREHSDTRPGIRTLLATAVVVIACVSCSKSAGGAKASAAPPTTRPQEPPITFPAIGPGQTCTADSTPPASVQITIVYHGSLFGASPDGSSVQCLGGTSGYPVEWSADGSVLRNSNDQLTVFGPSGPSDYGGLFVPERGDNAYTFVRPKATGLYVTDDSDGLELRSITPAAPPNRIGNFTNGGPLAVSPSGNNIALIAVGPDGRRGLWLTDTTGNTATMLLPITTSEVAGQQRYASLRPLSFVSETELIYEAGPASGSAGQDQYLVMNTTTQQSRVIGSYALPGDLGTYETVLVSAGPPIRIAASNCGSQLAAQIFTEGSPSVTIPLDPDQIYAQVVGWLPSGELLVMARADSCDGSGDLLSFKPGDASTRLLAQHASGAAIRISNG